MYTEISVAEFALKLLVPMSSKNHMWAIKTSAEGSKAVHIYGYVYIEQIST